MKCRLSFVAVIILVGISLESSFEGIQVHALDTATSPAVQEGATNETGAPTAPTEAPIADNTAAPSKETTAEEKPAEEESEEEKTVDVPVAAFSGGASAREPKSGVVKVIDSNQQAADQANMVSRTGGMIAGVSLLILIAYFLTRKRTKPNG